MVMEEQYQQALLIRRTEDTFLELFSYGKMNGTVHTCNGQEFSAVAFCSRLQNDDFIFSNHRCHGHYIARTDDVEGLIAELMGKASGVCGGIGSSQHLCSENFFSNGIQGGIVPVAAGMALAEKKKDSSATGSSAIGIVFIGDGTLGEGVVYETFNLASLLGLPLLIVCENNGYAQSTAQVDNLAGSILDRPRAFGIKTYHSNTWDLEELFENASSSIDYVRENSRPAFHLVDTYRLNAHSKSDDNRCPDEVGAYVKKDPLNVFRDADPVGYERMLAPINERIAKAVERIEQEPALKNEDYHEQCADETGDLAFIELERFNERVISRINLFFDETIAKDKTVIFIGEDVASPYGGAFKASKDLSHKYPGNVISTPISEAGITGLSNGLALGGFKPFLEIMFGDFITLSMDQIINHASKFFHMYNKKVKCPIVIRTPMGGGRGYGPTHSQTLDKLLAGIDNIKLIALNSFVDPKLIYHEIYSNEAHPVIVSENKLDYGRMVGNQFQENYAIERSIEAYPVVLCKPMLAEPTLTIVSYGGIATDVFNALLDIFAETEFVPELIILSKLSPLDVGPIVKSVKKTKNIIVVEEGGREYGIGAEILSSVLEQCLNIGINTISRIGALPVPIPSARSLEEHALPNKAIVEHIVQRLSL